MVDWIRPRDESEINVGQYGWEKTALQKVDLLEEYLQKAMEIYESFVKNETEYEEVAKEIDVLVAAFKDAQQYYQQFDAKFSQYNTDITNMFNTIAGVKTAVETIQTAVAGMRDAVNIALTDVKTRQADVATKHTDTITNASKAAASATTAHDAELKAKAWADNDQNVPVETGKFSAKHWAALAQSAASTAMNSLVFKGAFDASAGTPPPSPAPTDPIPYYRVSVAGTVAGTAYTRGDFIYWDHDHSVWYKIEGEDAVQSVNGQKGAVVLTAADLNVYTKTEGDARYIGKTFQLNGHPMNGSSLALSAHDVGALPITGGTVTGKLKVTPGSYLGFLVEQNAYQVGMDTSSTAGEVVFGGKAASASDFENYIRIGANKLQFHTGANNYNIFHDGHLPTAGAIGAMPVHTTALTTQDLDTVKATGYYVQNSTANATAEKHYPLNVAGVLRVFPSTGSGGIMQEFLAYTGGRRLFIRAFYNSNWDAWTEVGKAPTATDLGVYTKVESDAKYVSLGGAQEITGLKTFRGNGDAIVIRPVASGQPSYIEFRNSTGATSVGFVGKNSGDNNYDMMLKNGISGAALTIDQTGNINLFPKAGYSITAAGPINAPVGVVGAVKHMGGSTSSYQAADSGTVFHIAAGSGNNFYIGKNLDNSVRLLNLDANGNLSLAGNTARVKLPDTAGTSIGGFGFIDTSAVWKGGLEYGRSGTTDEIYISHQGISQFAIRNNATYVQNKGQLQIVNSSGGAFAGVELHIPGKHAAMMYLEQGGSVRFASSNGAFGEAQIMAVMTPDAFTANKSIHAKSETRGWGDWSKVAFNVAETMVNAGSLTSTISHAIHDAVGGWAIQQNYGFFQQDSQTEAGFGAHCFWMTDGGSFNQRWLMTNNGVFASPTGWTIASDANIVGNAWALSGTNDLSTYINKKIAAGSDIKLKENISESKLNATSTINEFKFKEFDWKEDNAFGNEGHVDIGVIAQELESVKESLVKTVKFGDEEIKTLDTTQLLMTALKAIQEIDSRLKKAGI